MEAFNFFMLFQSYNLKDQFSLEHLNLYKVVYEAYRVSCKSWNRDKKKKKAQNLTDFAKLKEYIS